MKVFLSSVISGFEQYRDAAAGAVKTLDHQVIRAEDWGASPQTPQQACLKGVRDSDLVLLMIGARYGNVQRSGLSATHEEFREAKDHKDILVFVQKGIQREPAQQEALTEVQDWASGSFTEEFQDAGELRDAIIRAIHRLEVSRARGAPDEAEMLVRAEQLVPRRSSSASSLLSIVVTGGPQQQLIRPSEFENRQFANHLQQMAMFGDATVLSTNAATDILTNRGTLSITQGTNRISVDQEGSICIIIPARPPVSWQERGVPNVLIEEDIHQRITRGLRFAGQVLDLMDGVHRISHVVPIVALVGANYMSWRTRTEHEASPNQIGINLNAPERSIVRLSPPQRKRVALTRDTNRLADDFTALLRREWRS